MREKTAREKAMEFAKSVPKPKNNVYSDFSRDEDGTPLGTPGLGNIEEEAFDANGNTLTGNELNELNSKHEILADEIEKIKQMIM